MNKIKLIVSISIIILLSGCVNEQSKENVPVSTPSVPMVTSVPTTKTPVNAPVIYNEANDLAPNAAKEYTYIDFFSKPTSDNILINVDITAKLGTMIEIKDKKDMGCLDVINKNRGTTESVVAIMHDTEIEIDQMTSDRQRMHARDQLLLYASDNVIKGYDNWIKYTDENPEGHGDRTDVELFGKFLLEIRRDILGKTQLTVEDIINLNPFNRG